MFGLGNNYSVSVKFLADMKSFTSGVASGTKALDNFGKRAQAVGMGLTKSLTVPLIAVGTAATNASLKLNKSMADVATLIPGNIKRIEELKRGVQDLALTWGKTTGDLSRGLYEVVSAFGDTNETLLQLEISAKLATAGVSTTLDALKLLSAITKGYGDTSAEAMKKASDLMMTVVKMGQTTFPELASTITGTIPLAASLGVKIEEVAALFATLTGVTGNAAEVGTQVEGMLAGLMKQTGDMSSAIRKLGYATAQEMVEAEGLVGAYQKLIETTDGTQEAAAKLLARREGLTALFSLVGGQADVFTKKMNAMGDAVGYTDEAVREQTEGINAAGFAWDKFKAKVEVTMQQWGDKLLPMFEKLLDKFDKVVTKLGEVADKFEKADKKTQDFYMDLGLILVVAGPVIAIIGTLARALATTAGKFAAAAVAGYAFGRMLRELYEKRIVPAYEVLPPMRDWPMEQLPSKERERILKNRDIIFGGLGHKPMGELFPEMYSGKPYDSSKETGDSLEKKMKEAEDAFDGLGDTIGNTTEKIEEQTKAVKKYVSEAEIAAKRTLGFLFPAGAFPGGGGGPAGAMNQGPMYYQNIYDKYFKSFMSNPIGSAYNFITGGPMQRAIGRSDQQQSAAGFYDANIRPVVGGFLENPLKSVLDALGLGDGGDETQKPFQDLGQALLNGIQGMTDSILSGDIGGAVANMFSMLGQSIGSGVGEMIQTSIGGGGLFGSIMGSLGGGLVGVGISLLGGLFGSNKSRGSEPSKPIYTYDTNWDKYFKFGMSLPMSFVYSGRSSGSGVDPHGRMLSGWSTGQHFDC